MHLENSISTLSCTVQLLAPLFAADIQVFTHSVEHFSMSEVAHFLSRSFIIATFIERLLAESLHEQQRSLSKQYTKHPWNVSDNLHVCVSGWMVASVLGVISVSYTSLGSDTGKSSRSFSSGLSHCCLYTTKLLFIISCRLCMLPAGVMYDSELVPSTVYDTTRNGMLL